MPKRLKLIEDDEPLPPPDPIGDGTMNLDDRLIRSFCSLIERGLSIDGACGFYLISQYTFSSWARRGKAFILNGCKPSEHRLYGRLVQALDQAMSKYRLLRSELLHNPDHNPKSRLIEFRILERRDRAVWGKRELTNNEGLIDPSDKYL